MPASDVVWRPDATLIEQSNVGRFMQAEQVGDFATLVARSIDDPEWFWDAVVRFLDLVAGGTFMKRIADPQEIVGPVCYLVSDASSFVTGDDISVSGGMQK